MASPRPIEPPAAAIHLSSVRVRYAETDKAGVVYHGNYLPWFEVGRTELLRGMGLAYSEFEKEYGLFLTVVEAHLQYIRPARYDDVIEIGTWTSSVGRVRFRLDHRLRQESSGEVICRGHVVLACVGQDGRPVGLPEELRILLQNGLEQTGGKRP